MDDTPSPVQPKAKHLEIMEGEIHICSHKINLSIDKKDIIS